MRTPLTHGLAILLVGVGILGCATDATHKASGGGSASVQFGDPSQFTDLRGSGAFGDAEQERKLAELRQFIEQEARRQLPEGRHLDVRITNIDQSGSVRPGGLEVRVSRSTNPAYVDLEYSLKSEDAVIRSGTETLSSSAPSTGVPSTSGGGMPLVEDALRGWLHRLGRLK